MPRPAAARILAAASVADNRVRRAVVRAVKAWLEAVRDAILPGRTGPPAMTSWPPATAWVSIADQHITPAVRDAWTRRWRDSTAVADPDQWLTDYLAAATNRLRGFARESWESVRDTISDGVAAGDTPQQLRDRVGRALRWDAQSRDLARRVIAAERVIDDPAATPAARDRARQRRRTLLDRKDVADRTWQWRADRIARTESGTAFNAGAYAAARVQADQYGDRIGLEWWATLDDATRRTHRRAHGQVVPVGERFTVGNAHLLFPLDPTGPASEVISCRCIALETDLD